MKSDRTEVRPPNILLVVTDQQRGDCLSIEDHPVVQTPAIDALSREGVRFRSAYSACPICIPARRTLMSGQRPATHGVVFNYDTPLDTATLPQALADAGYHTHLAGKLHLYPVRKHYGFHSMDLADGFGSGPFNERANDHHRHLARQGVDLTDDTAGAHGVGGNSWNARPWHLDEQLHHTNWCVSRAIEFLQRRDPTRPFFLNVGFIMPHPPCIPPQHYHDRYAAMNLPEPVCGEWARLYDAPQAGFPLNMAGDTRLCLHPAMNHQLRAAYYACINHVDDQIARLLRWIPQNTVIVFCSDHGEMLGDHQFFGKLVPYEPSARVPLVMRFPPSMGLPTDWACDQPVELMDIMPTLLEVAGAPIPDSVEGRSVLALLKGGGPWRDYIHGECSRVCGLNSGVHYLTDGRWKYIWWPGLGREQLFDLKNDPQELNDLAHRDTEQKRLDEWRLRLAHELTGRPEGFVDSHGMLRRLEGPTTYCLPGFECDDHDMPTLHPDHPPLGFQQHPGLGRRDAPTSTTSHHRPTAAAPSSHAVADSAG
ncbi:MAG: sulfatase-like hydrolase/transferase [bacterium]